MRITDKDILEQEQRQIEKWGFVKFKIESAYNMWNINERRDKEQADRHCCMRMYDGGLRKGEAFKLVNALLY